MISTEAKLLWTLEGYGQSCARKEEEECLPRPLNTRGVPHWLQSTHVQLTTGSGLNRESTSLIGDDACVSPQIFLLPLALEAMATFPDDTQDTEICIRGYQSG